MFVAGRRRGLVIGLTATGMVVLSACSSGGSAPRSLPALSTTPAAATSTAPPTSKAADLAAASAVVRRYFELINGLEQDMDPSAFEAIETGNCECRKFPRSVANVAAKHERYFGRAQIRGLTPAADSTSLVEVLVSYDAGEGGIRADDGQVIARGAPRHGVSEMFYVVRQRGGWYISKILVISRGTAS